MMRVALKTFSIVTMCIAVLIALNVRSAAQTPPAVREPRSMAKLVAAAAKEGELDVAWGSTYGGADGVKTFQAAIDKTYHIGLQIHYSPVANGAQMQTQIAQEVRAGHPTSSDILFHVRDRDLAAVAQPVDWRRYVPDLPASDIYFDGRAVVVANVLEAIIYNKQRVAPADVPKSFADLLKPQWKGKIASSSYQGLFANYLGLPEMMGHAGMLAFYQRYSQQLAGLMNCGETDRVVSGEFLIFALDCGDHQTREEIREGKPLGIVHPREGTAISAFAPGIPLTAAHPAAARLFIAFMLSRAGQEILWNVMAADNASLPGSHMAKIIADERRKGVRFISTFGLSEKHPELATYANEINAIVNQIR